MIISNYFQFDILWQDYEVIDLTDPRSETKESYPPSYSNPFESIPPVKFNLPQAAPDYSVWLNDGNSKENGKNLFYEIPLQQTNEDYFSYSYRDAYDYYPQDYYYDYNYYDYHQHNLPTYNHKGQDITKIICQLICQRNRTKLMMYMNM